MTERQNKKTNLEIPRDSERALRAIADMVTPGTRVTLEGTPIYIGKEWDSSHEFGTNTLLPAAAKVLSEKGCNVTHHAMVDDFTTGKTEEFSAYTDRMQNQPDSLHYESSFAEEAINALRDLNAKGKTFRRGGEIALRSPNQPRLQVQSGRVSCELLDACFQQQKEGDVHVIIHPTEFVRQQEGMREVLKEINGGELPGKFINVFFKKGNMSRVLETDKNGKTKRINF